MININIKHVAALAVLSLLASCTASNAISYDVANQEIKSCHNRIIKNVTITNDSNLNESYLIMWNDKTTAPEPGALKLYPLSEGYTVYYEDTTQLALQPDATYTIRRSGGDRSDYKIKVYTDKNGLIYKTDQADCR